MKKSINEIRAEWINDFAIGLREEFNLNHNEALQRAASLMDRVSAVRPADNYYWPSKAKSERDAAILREFNGRNLQEIKHKYGVSKATVYSIRSKALEKKFEAKHERKSSFIPKNQTEKKIT